MKDLLMIPESMVCLCLALGLIIVVAASGFFYLMGKEDGRQQEKGETKAPQ